MTTIIGFSVCPLTSWYYGCTIPHMPTIITYVSKDLKEAVGTLTPEQRAELGNKIRSIIRRTVKK